MIFYTFPGCPYCERIEIMIVAKSIVADVEVVELDISAPRPAWLLEKTRGTTALPAASVTSSFVPEASFTANGTPASGARSTPQ